MPLLFDLPFDQLETYRGTNPRPSDFDEYWESGLAEMHGLDSQIDFIPSAFESKIADSYHLYFTGVGGAKVHAKFLKPKNQSKPGPAVLMFHGYSGNSGDWNDKLAYVAEGFTVAAMDCRGQGGLSQDSGSVKGNTLNGHIIRGLDDTPKSFLYRSIFLDTAQLAGIIMDLDLVDADRVGATGGSQGGALTLACAALSPRIKKAAPVYPFLSDYLRVWEMDMDVDAYHELRQWFRLFDPLHERRNEVFEKLGYIDVQHLASRIQAEVLMGVGLMDTICPPSTQFAAYNKIESSKSLAIYPDFGHEHLPGLNDRIFKFMSAM